MALESPLFQSSMELLGHSITHFIGAEKLDRKLLILHLANAIELLLKDMLLDCGESIYKNAKETITVTTCIDSLKARGTTVPYLNKIELLIDERNALQHRFGSPDELTAIFYMTIATEFFRDILKQHYSSDLDEMLEQFAVPKDLAEYRKRKPTNDSELENLKRLARIHPLGALLSAMSYLEGRIDAFANDVGLGPELRARPAWASISHRFLGRYGVDLPPELVEEMEIVRKTRNLASHGRKEPSRAEVEKAIAAVEKFERALQVADKGKVRATVQELREQRLKERDKEAPLGTEKGPVEGGSPMSSSQTGS